MKIQKQIIELKQAFKPDLIHINFSGYTTFYQIATARKQPTPTLIALHINLAGLRTGLGTSLEELFHLADWVTAPSKLTLESAHHTIPWIASRSSVIYGCAEEIKMTPAPLSFDHACILGIGRLSREKGFDLLVDAFSLIADRYPDTSLRIIGDGPERVFLEQQVIKLGLKNRVELIGNVSDDDKQRFINDASMVVVPSRHQETFGLVAVEAAWMGRPVVATCAGGLAEIIVDKKTGLIVEMENPLALADAIVSLLSHPENAERMGRAGRLRVQKEFSMSKFVDAYDSLYLKIAAK